MPLRSSAKAARIGGILLLVGAMLVVLAVSYGQFVDILRS